MGCTERASAVTAGCQERASAVGVGAVSIISPTVFLMMTVRRSMTWKSQVLGMLGEEGEAGEGGIV